jgi:NAD(P)-dependent dehydrogenase (short-subunit alcohol dehydrogenase family)
MDINLKGIFWTANTRSRNAQNSAIVSTASDAGLIGGDAIACLKGRRPPPKSLAIEWGQGFASTVCAGRDRTPIWTVSRRWRPGPPEEVWARMARAHPIGRVGEPEEVGKAVAFLASDEASFITGVALSVDGGFAAGPPGGYARD